MFSRLQLLCVGAALFAFSTNALAIDPFFPEFGNKGIDVVQYDLDLDVDPVANTLDALATLHVRALRKLETFSLDLHGLTVRAVHVNGVPTAFERNGDKLVITPRKALPPGGMFTTVVHYDGEPEGLDDPTAPGSGLLLGWFQNKGATYVVSEPVGASTFFPANDEPTDRATFTFNVTVPEGYTAAASGRFVRSKPEGSKRRFIWDMNFPMTTWLATVHVNKFNVDVRSAADGTPVRTYTPSSLPQSHVDGYALASEMLTYFETIAGPYPFDSYGSAVVQDQELYYALETQAMSTFPVGRNPPSEALVAHELAHQWFGNSVSVAKWEDLWIAEGTATYFEVAWDFRNDPAGFDAMMLAIYDYVADNNIGPAVVEAPDQLFTDRTYYRGAAALYALRLQVGESAFNKILRRFAQDNRNESVTSAAFIRTAQQVSGDSGVRPLLHAWLYEQAVPDLPGTAAFRQRTSPAPRPDIVGGRCGSGSHRGAKRTCD